ncbi:OLC1v1024349C1 [Oldenlandia corymbosa var. corymbosa]|uniref:OLC1v1024349C1 n=1 Tax=Oldenlandia corymbosa var. corymbosa TaxID=529605 RepID=A0AAV1C2V0_OLDCO|nr:OLC1v1024349C1 [Oldenlandia corymbosa var. corymbosa]
MGQIVKDLVHPSIQEQLLMKQMLMCIRRWKANPTPNSSHFLFKEKLLSRVLHPAEELRVLGICENKMRGSICDEMSSSAALALDVVACG